MPKFALKSGPSLRVGRWDLESKPSHFQKRTPGTFYSDQAPRQPGCNVGVAGKWGENGSISSSKPGSTTTRAS